MEWLALCNDLMAGTPAQRDGLMDSLIEEYGTLLGVALTPREIVYLNPNAYNELRRRHAAEGAVPGAARGLMSHCWQADDLVTGEGDGDWQAVREKAWLDPQMVTAYARLAGLESVRLLKPLGDGVVVARARYSTVACHDGLVALSELLGRWSAPEVELAQGLAASVGGSGSAAARYESLARAVEDLT